MPAVRLQLSMSLDGYVAGPRQSLENPLGEGGMALHEWALATRTFREMFGSEGGEMYALNADGTYRWWSDNPPYHGPVYVLTHHARDSFAMEGGTTFHFVTDGIGPALELACAAAGDQDVVIGGGASTAGQYLRAGLVDELELHVSPIILGSGERLLEDLDDGLDGLEPVDVLSSQRVAHFRFVRS